jgi:hypothetical protein
MVTSMSTVPTRHEAWCDVAAHDAGNAVEPGPCSSRAVTVERVSVWRVEDAASIAVSRLDRRGDDWSWTLGQPRVFCRSELNLSGEQTQRVAAAMGTAQHLAEDAAGSGPVGS